MGDGGAVEIILSDRQIARVYAVGYSADDAARITRELQSTLDNQAEVIELSAEMLGQTLPDVGRVTCAAVITLQNAALRRSAYLEFLQSCIEQVIRRDDFRLYLLLDDVSAEQIYHSRPTSDDPVEQVLARLVDTVQYSAASTVETVANQVRGHVKTLEESRRIAKWRRTRLSIAAIAARVAMIIQLLCLAPALFLVLWLPVWDPHATLREYGGHEAEVAVICGIAAVPLLVLLLFSYTRYGPFLIHMHKQRLGMLYAGVGSVIGVPVMMVPLRLHAPLAWIAGGRGQRISTRCCAAVRVCGSPPAARNLDQDHRTAAWAIGAQRLAPVNALPTWIDPMRAPLLPLAFPRVFISYTRASQWGQHLAGALSRRLAAGGAGVFSDHAIPEGTSWRRALNQNLGHSSVLIALVDADTVVREWPAAEVEAALLGQAMAGSPQLVVILAPSLPPPDDDAWRWLPVFRTVLAPRDDQRETGPHCSRRQRTRPSMTSSPPSGRSLTVRKASFHSH